VSRVIASFTTVNTRRLRGRGLRGHTVSVALTHDAIVVTGGEGGVLHLPLDRIARMRIGFEEYRYGISRSLQIWPADGSGRVRLLAWNDLRAYGDFVRASAAAMLHPTRPAVVETGAGWFVPLAGFAAFGTPTLAAAVAVVRNLARSGDWTSPALAFLCGLAVLVAFGWWTLPRYVPRRITDPADIARSLPGC